MRDRPIVIAASDAARLRGLLTARGTAVQDQDHHELTAELERALVLAKDEVPADVITMNSRASVLDLTSGVNQEWMLVFPAEADVSAQRISVLAPLGTALLGYREGDEVEWEMPGGLRRLRVGKVRQPEARGILQRREVLAAGVG